MDKWVEIRRYRRGMYRLRSSRGDVCIAPLKKLIVSCEISKKELRELISDAIKKGEIQLKDRMLDEIFED